MNSSTVLFAFLCFVVVLCCEANDSVVEIGAGGLIFTEEKNISMNREKLEISETEISVQYEFENTSKNDIEVTVGFPIPPFGINSPSNTQTYPPNFNDFKVMVNGSQVEYFTEVKAVTESGEDISNFLVEKKINYKTFASFDIFPLADGLINSPSELPNYEINALTKVDRQYLVEKGALSEDGMPLWDNKITYYWRQKFPAGEVTKISHKYTPYVGGAFTYEHFENSFDNAGSACIDPKLRERMSGYLNGDSGFPQKFNRRVDFTTVSYILVTANSWKMPIKKFELIIRKQASNAKENRKPYISLCWDGNLKKVSETEFKSEMLNFKPNKDLLIYWYYLN